jgi:KaiC/GvpD/RAD55 family RecA-like ATPase
VIRLSFGTIGRRTGAVTRTPLPQANAYAMIRRRAVAAGVATEIGMHAYKITDDGIVVHPRLEALYAYPSRRDRSGVTKIPTGIEELDKLLEGGVPAASTTVVMGPSGSGKTILGFHFERMTRTWSR